MRGKLLRTLGSDRRGAVAVLFALSSTALIGFVALGAEVALWYIAKHAAQGAADTAAYSAVVAYRAGETGDIATTAKAVAAQYGFVDESGGVSVAVNQPPRSGRHRNDANAIEVVITAPQLPLFSKLFAAAPVVAARAVAVTGSLNGSGQCVVTLGNGGEIVILGHGASGLGCGSGSAIRLVE